MKILNTEKYGLFEIEKKAESTEILKEVCKELDLDDLAYLIESLIEASETGDTLDALECIFGECERVCIDTFYFKDKDIIVEYSGSHSYGIERLEFYKVCRHINLEDDRR